jgi:hypothetical protein
MTPISLLAAMIVMRIVLSVIAGLQLVEADAAVLLHRQVGDAVAVLLEPLAGVDDRLVLGDRGDDVVALLAVHLGDALDRQVVDSVAPLVKTISFALAPIRSATCLRAFSTASSASQPNGWLRLAALPKCSVKYGSIASTTRGSHGVVA